MARDIVRGLKIGMGLLYSSVERLYLRCSTCGCAWAYYDEDDDLLCGQCGRIQR